MKFPQAMFTGIKKIRIFKIVDIIFVNNKFDGEKVGTININKILNESLWRKWGPQLIFFFIKLVGNMWGR